MLELVSDAVGGHRSRQRIHPATKNFSGDKNRH